MATYLFRCPECSVFEVAIPMAAVGSTHACPVCAQESRRVWTAPALSTASAALHRAVDAADASAEAPQVVRSVPAGRPRPRSRRWSPTTGPAPVDATHRPAGPYPSLPRW